MSNLENRKAAEKAILDCRKALFECARQREQINMSRDLAKVYVDDLVMTEAVSMNAAMRMQEALEDKYYTEEGGILSSLWETIKEMFRSIKAWLFGEDAPSTKASDYPVQQVVPDAPTDVKGLESAVDDIEKLTKDIVNMDDPDKAEETAKTIKEKIENALKPTPGKVAAGAIAIGTVTALLATSKIIIPNLEKRAEELKKKIEDPNITEDDKKASEKKLNAINTVLHAYTLAEKRVYDILGKASDTAKDVKDNVNKAVKRVYINDSMSKAQKKKMRQNWFQWKFRYNCTANNLGAHSKGIPEELFPDGTSDDVKTKEGLTASDLAKIESALGIKLPLLPDDYKQKVQDAMKKAEEEAEKSNDDTHWFNYIPSSWWKSKNPYRIPRNKMKAIEAACDADNVDYKMVMIEYCKAIGYDAKSYPTGPFEPYKPEPDDAEDITDED